MDYSKKIEDMKRKLADTARDVDQKYKIKETLDRGAKTAAEGLKKGTEAAAAGIDTARRELNQLDEDYGISGKVKRSVEEVAGAVKEGLGKAEDQLQKLDQEYDISGRAKGSVQDLADTVKKSARTAGEKADALLGEAGKYYDRFGRVSSAAEKTARAGRSLKSALDGAVAWIKRNPGKAALMSVSVLAGVEAGRAFPGLDAVVLGAGRRGHWLFHSALAAYGLRKLWERYFDYLHEQEQLIAAGKVTEAEAARIEFQRTIARYVGAPLLGAFSLATGAVLMAESLSPGRFVVGAPIDLIVGGNPLLSTIWLFSNGLICVHNGYKFFLMAVADEEAVARMAREARYLLPIFESR